MMKIILLLSMVVFGETKTNTAKPGLYAVGPTKEAEARSTMAALSLHIFQATSLKVGNYIDRIAGLSIDEKGVDLIERPDRPLTKAERDAILAAIVSFSGGQ